MSLQNIVFHNEKVELVGAIHENNKQIPNTYLSLINMHMRVHEASSIVSR